MSSIGSSRGTRLAIDTQSSTAPAFSPTPYLASPPPSYTSQASPIPGSLPPYSASGLPPYTPQAQRISVPSQPHIQMLPTPIPTQPQYTHPQALPLQLVYPQQIPPQQPHVIHNLATFPQNQQLMTFPNQPHPRQLQMIPYYQQPQLPMQLAPNVQIQPVLHPQLQQQLPQHSHILQGTIIVPPPPPPPQVMYQIPVSAAASAAQSTIAGGNRYPLHPANTSVTDNSPERFITVPGIEGDRRRNRAASPVPSLSDSISSDRILFHLPSQGGDRYQMREEERARLAGPVAPRRMVSLSNNGRNRRRSSTLAAVPRTTTPPVRGMNVIPAAQSQRHVSKSDGSSSGCESSSSSSSDSEPKRGRTRRRAGGSRRRSGNRLRMRVRGWPMW